MRQLQQRKLTRCGVAGATNSDYPPPINKDGSSHQEARSLRAGNEIPCRAPFRAIKVLGKLDMERSNEDVSGGF